jgi:hypothetical protein
MSGVVRDCELVGGAGIVTDKSGAPCPLLAGGRYLTEDQPDLESTFACLAEVGTLGSGNEAPMAILQRATGPEQVGPGGCNEGFLRSDALLVVTFITDEEDDHESAQLGGSPGDPGDWKAALVANKGGREEDVVVLGLIGDSDLPGATCAPLDKSTNQTTGAEGAARLRELVELFGDRGRWGSVCAPDYTPFFVEAVGVVDLACDEFIPPG